MEGGVVAEGSVDHALKGKHYKRGLRCLRLMYEALYNIQLKLKCLIRIFFTHCQKCPHFEILVSPHVVPKYMA